jgi:uncharacterized secreted repeat protein (TIGR03808 family)
MPRRLSPLYSLSLFSEVIWKLEADSSTCASSYSSLILRLPRKLKPYLESLSESHRVFANRRLLLIGGLAAPFIFSRSEASETKADAAPALRRAIAEARRGGGQVVVPRGVNYVSRLDIAGDIRLVGADGDSKLVALGPGPILTLDRADKVTIQNLGLEGAGDQSSEETGLVEARDVSRFELLDCEIARASGYAVRLERCGGRLERNFVHGIKQSALHSLDATGLTVVDNRVEDCGANGLQIWRSSQGYDGAIIRGNRIARIRAEPGGDGPYGNAISVFRAGGVSTTGNVIRDVAFSAVRYNSSADALIANNSCTDIGETALYVEFAFRGAVVSANVVDGASTGVSVTNVDQGGRIAAVTGNMVRNLDRPLPQGGEHYGVGIHVEADTAVSGNTIENARYVGLDLGYGVGLSNVAATGNVIADCGYGVAVSVAPGAGGATIRNNRIARARRGAIVGLTWETLASADLVAEAAKYPRLAISGNDIE